MVEWQPGGATSEPGPGADSTTPAPPPALASESSPAAAGPPADTAGWEVSWPGKSTLVPARDAEQDSARRRVYFLLPPQAPVPATITISQPGGASLEVKPLPAIFPEGFNVESGPHGVLHTIWAKKRVSELQREIDAEMRANAESIGVEIAVAEKQFIIDTFLSPPAPPTSPDSAPLPPRSPIGGRLGDKLKGLRLATSPADLVPTGMLVQIANLSHLSSHDNSKHVHWQRWPSLYSISARRRHCRGVLFSPPRSTRSPCVS